jgi:hypothetical protein
MTDAKINFPFPHRELTLIDGHPNPQSLKKLFSEVYDNAFTVKSQAGGGQFGHLGAVAHACHAIHTNKNIIKALHYIFWQEYKLGRLYIALDGTIAYVTPPDPSIQPPHLLQPLPCKSLKPTAYMILT